MGKKAEAREGDYTEPVILDLTTLEDIQSDEISDELEESNFLLGSDDDQVGMDHGERSSDEDFEPFLSESEDESFVAHGPPNKRSKHGENTSPATYGTKSCRLETSSTNNELILGFIDDGDLWQHGLTFEIIFGRHYPYFTDFKLIIPDSSKRSFSCRLSADGKKKYKTGRRGALFQMGDTLHFKL